MGQAGEAGGGVLRFLRGGVVAWTGCLCVRWRVDAVGAMDTWGYYCVILNFLYTANDPHSQNLGTNIGVSLFHF